MESNREELPVAGPHTHVEPTNGFPSTVNNRGHGGALVDSMPFDWRVVGSNPDLVAT